MFDKIDYFTVYIKDVYSEFVDILEHDCNEMTEDQRIRFKENLEKLSYFNDAYIVQERTNDPRPYRAIYFKDPH